MAVCSKALLCKKSLVKPSEKYEKPEIEHFVLRRDLSHISFEYKSAALLLGQRVRFHWLNTAKDRIPSQGSPREICGWSSGNETLLRQALRFSPVRCRSTSALYLFSCIRCQCYTVWMKQTVSPNRPHEKNYNQQRLPWNKAIYVTTSPENNDALHPLPQFIDWHILTQLHGFKKQSSSYA